MSQPVSARASTEAPIIDPALDLEQEILRLKRERNAIVLAHYYQDGEVQDLADVIGDSLQLAQAAKKTDADVIACTSWLRPRRSSIPTRSSCCQT
jgi:quinolinate synthase